MRRDAVIATLLLSVLALAAGPSSKPAAAQKPSDDQPRATVPGSQNASALLLVVGNPLRPPAPAPGDTMPGMPGPIGSLIRSWSQRAGEPGELRDYQVYFTPLSVSPEGDTLGIMQVMGPRDAGAALALAQKRFQEALLEIRRLSLDSVNRKLELAHQRVQRAEKRIQDVTAELGQLRETAIHTGEALQPQDPQVSAAVRRDRLSLGAELAGLQAQRAAIIEQIAKAKEKLDTAQKEQQLVLNELAQVAKLCEDELARTQVLWKSGTATRAEVAKAQVAAAQSRADLADRRRALVSEAGGGLLGRLNEQLVDAQIAIATTQARLKETERSLDDLEKSAYSPVNPLVIKYEQTRRALENAYAEQEVAAAELARLYAGIDAIPAPKVIVIGGEAKPK